MRLAKDGIYIEIENLIKNGKVEVNKELVRMYVEIQPNYYLRRWKNNLSNLLNQINLNGM